MNDIVFPWDVYEEQWDEMFHQLDEHKKDKGNCNVPISHENQNLASWGHKQRSNYNWNLLSQEHIDWLNIIGFKWNPHQDVRNKKWFESLVELQGDP